MNDKLRPLDELLAAAEEALDLERRAEIKKKEAGAALRHVRKANGMNQEQLASFLGKSQAYVSMVEKGRRVISEPTINKLTELDNNQKEGATGDENPDSNN